MADRTLICTISPPYSTIEAERGSLRSTEGGATLLPSGDTDPDAATVPTVSVGDGKIRLKRDATGRVPLFWTRDDDGTVHVHHSALTLARKLGNPVLDETWLAGFLLEVPEIGEATPFEGVLRVPPGYAATIHEGRHELDAWWPTDLSPLDIGFDEATEEAARLLDRSLAKVQGAPIMLSAGYDSNVLLTRLAATGKVPSALTASPSVHAEPLPGYGLDEFPLANASYVALGGADHHRVIAPSSGLAYALDLFETEERPFYNPSNSGWWNGLLETGATIGADHLVDGTAGNFTLGHDGATPLQRLAADGRWGDWVRAVVAARGKGSRFSFRASPPDWWRFWTAPIGAKRQVRDVFARRRDPAIRAVIDDALARRDRIDRIPDRIDQPETRLTHFVLHRDAGPHADAAYRRFGVTLHDPYADPDLVEFALRLPDALQRADGRPRAVQRAMLDPRIPEAIVANREAALQGCDWRAAAERDRPLMMQVVERLEDGHRGSGLFDARRLRKTLEQWPSGGWDQPEQVQTYRLRLQRALVSAAFAQWVADL